MSSYQTFTLDTLAFKDMLGLVLSSTPEWLNTATGSDDPKWYMLGSGGYDNFCWPGQLDYLMYKIECRGGGCGSSAGYPFVSEAPLFHTDKSKPLPEEVLKYKEEPGFIRQFVMPYLTNAIGSIFSSFKDSAG